MNISTTLLTPIWAHTVRTIMVHDDDCGETLDSAGLCPRCGFHPDMQSTGITEMETLHPAREAALFFLHDPRSADKLKVACIRWLDSHRLALV